MLFRSKAAEKEASLLVSWGHQCRERKRMAAMREGARVYPGLPISAALLDTHRHLIGVANGVVDLRTGELKPDARDDFITLRSRYPYVPTATAPRFERFIREITGLQDGTERPALAHYHQVCAGYFLTGEVREQKAFNESGKGTNGKNVKLDLFCHILGDMALEMPEGAFEKAHHAKHADAPSPTLRDMQGKRLVIAPEWKKGVQVDVELLKKVTGNEVLRARGVFKDAHTFPITGKVVVPSNYPMETRGIDSALAGRLHIVPYDKRWNRPGDATRDPALPDGDKDLKDTLRREAVGVLAWMVRGAVEYYARGLEPSPEVTTATVDYINDQNPFERWFATCTVLDEFFNKATAPTLAQVFDSYARFYADDGRKGEPNMNGFTAELKRKSVPKGEYGQGRGRMRYGLELP